jgi:putative acetyltransferase
MGLSLSGEGDLRHYLTRTMEVRPNLTIERASAPTPEVHALVEELEAELAAHYPPEQRHGLAIDRIFQPHIQFFIVRFEGQIAGCGGVALLEDFAEVKRMYVRPGCRGKGVADALLAELERQTIIHGLTTLRLETGVHQEAAHQFYRRCGFVPCGAFEPYASLPPMTIQTSVFMEKRLDR